MTRRVAEVESLGQFDALIRRRTAAEPLRGVFVQSVDLTGRSALLRQVDPAGAVFLGCRLADGVANDLVARGALVFPTLPGLPFDPYRAALYTPDELYATPAGTPVSYPGCLDARVYAWARHWLAQHDIAGSLSVALHDHAITDALDEYLARIDPTRVVGVMGGHATGRDGADYADAVRLGCELTRRGRTILTGGGPGAMEAANLGAYLAPFPPSSAAQPVDEALELLAGVPSFDTAAGIDGWVQAAQAVRHRFPPDRAGASVGVPTWFYGHEPPNLFATAIAKYFLNPLREDTLLHRCRGGIVFLPGSAGTVQEIFQAGCENYYAADPMLVAPMVFVGRDAWTDRLPVWPLISRLGDGRLLGDRLRLVDSVDDAVTALTG